MEYHVIEINYCFQETIANLFFHAETSCYQPILPVGSISG